MLRGYLGKQQEPIGLQLIPGYSLEIVHLEMLGPLGLYMDRDLDGVSSPYSCPVHMLLLSQGRNVFNGS